LRFTAFWLNSKISFSVFSKLVCNINQSTCTDKSTWSITCYLQSFYICCYEIHNETFNCLFRLTSRSLADMLITWQFSQNWNCKMGTFITCTPHYILLCR
jgi:hypothetical protein